MMSGMADFKSISYQYMSLVYHFIKNYLSFKTWPIIFCSLENDGMMATYKIVGHSLVMYLRVSRTFGFISSSDCHIYIVKLFVKKS